FVATLTGLVLALAGCGPVELDHPQVGPGDALHAEWVVQASAPAAARVSGYVYNRTTYFAVRVRLRVELLGTGGAGLGVRWQWLPGSVPPSQRAYFEVRDLPLVAGYRVSVPVYTWQEGDRGLSGAPF
ncbi:MAG TPA: hypothetical protein VFL90_05010, partial [Methylomirabilota bacterium]|nr:hypothetical protein [Methylomirabilota bacterium]